MSSCCIEHTTQCYHSLGIEISHTSFFNSISNSSPNFSSSSKCAWHSFLNVNLVQILQVSIFSLFQLVHHPLSLPPKSFTPLFFTMHHDIFLYLLNLTITTSTHPYTQVHDPELFSFLSKHYYEVTTKTLTSLYPLQRTFNISFSKLHFWHHLR